jgi:hypothetical protein
LKKFVLLVPGVGPESGAASNRDLELRLIDRQDADPYSRDRYSADRLSADRYSGDRYSGDKYGSDRRSSDDRRLSPVDRYGQQLSIRPRPVDQTQDAAALGYDRYRIRGDDQRYYASRPSAVDRYNDPPSRLTRDRYESSQDEYRDPTSNQV